MQRTLVRIVLLVLLSVSCVSAFAGDTQTWSVQIVDDTAVLRTAPKTEMKFVRSTLDGLLSAGVEKLTLSPDVPPTSLRDTKQAYIVTIENGLARIQVTNDLPNKYTESMAKSLGSAGIKFVNVSKANR